MKAGLFYRLYGFDFSYSTVAEFEAVVALWNIVFFVVFNGT